MTQRTCCPHCGDTDSGYEFRQMEDHTMQGAWGEEPTSADSAAGRATIPVCACCGKRVRDAVNLEEITNEQAELERAEERQDR